MSDSTLPPPRPAATLPDRLPIPVVDNHLHLDIHRAGDPVIPLDRLLADARAVGVPYAVQIGCDLPGAEWTVRAVTEHPQLLGGIALHPNEVPRLAAAGKLDTAYERIEELAAHDRIRVIGETGLDYYRTGPEGRPAQHAAFRWHIELAKATGKVLQIHDRDAHEDVLAILDEQGAPEHVVLHCFSGDAPFAQRCLDRGFHLSFAGTVTFKNARPLRDALAIAPLDRILVETDAPYLAPSPHRGARNSSSLVPHIVRAMADVRNVPVATLCEAIAVNSARLYGSWS